MLFRMLYAVLKGPKALRQNQTVCCLVYIEDINILSSDYLFITQSCLFLNYSSHLEFVTSHSPGWQLALCHDSRAEGSQYSQGSTGWHRNARGIRIVNMQPISHCVSDIDSFFDAE